MSVDQESLSVTITQQRPVATATGPNQINVELQSRSTTFAVPEASVGHLDFWRLDFDHTARSGLLAIF